MLGWIKSCFLLSVALLAISCVQDKKDNFSATEDASGLLSAAALRVAIYYVGEAKCQAHLEAKGRDEQYIDKVLLINKSSEYIEEGKNTHRLDGNKAELSSREFVTQQANPQLSGDKFLQDNDIARTLETLKENCRRLLLSIDSDTMPRISSDNLYHTSGHFEADSDAADNFWSERFAADFGDFGGKITCGSGEQGKLKSLCSFSQINAGNRYFTYLYPKQGEDSLAAEVTYTRDGEELTGTITIESIALNALQLPTTKLSDIVVNTDCGENNSCLFAESEDSSLMLECKVEGQDCGEGFAFTVQKEICDASEVDCPKATATPTSGKLCTGTATVAALVQHEINISCEFSTGSEICPKCKKKLRLRAQHLSGKMCVKSIEGFRLVANMEIEAGACEREDDGNLKELRLELSFAL